MFSIAIVFKNKNNNDKLNTFNDYWKMNAIASRWDPKEVVFVKRILQHALPENIRVEICDFLFDHYIKKTNDSIFILKKQNYSHVNINTIDDYYKAKTLKFN